MSSLSIPLPTPFHLGADRLPAPLEPQHIDNTAQGFVTASIRGLSPAVEHDPTAWARLQAGAAAFSQEPSRWEGSVQRTRYFESRYRITRQLVINPTLARLYLALRQTQGPEVFVPLLESPAPLLAWPYCSAPLQAAWLEAYTHHEHATTPIFLLYDRTLPIDMTAMHEWILTGLGLHALSDPQALTWLHSHLRGNRLTYRSILVYLASLSCSRMDQLAALGPLKCPSYWVSPYGPTATQLRYHCLRRTPPLKTLAKSSAPLEFLEKTTCGFPLLTPIDLRPATHRWATPQSLYDLWLLFANLPPDQALCVEKPTSHELDQAVIQLSLDGHALDELLRIRQWIQTS